MTNHRWVYPKALGSVALGTPSLLIQRYVVELGDGPFALGLLGAVAALIGAPGAIVWGRLADRTTDGRVVVLGSLAGVASASGLLFLFPLVPTVPLAFAANALPWLAFAAAGPVLTLLVVADAPESTWSREIALLNTYQGYGWTGGLLLGILWSTAVGGLLESIAVLRSLFVDCGAVAAVAAAFLGRWMPAPPPIGSSGSIRIASVARSGAADGASGTRRSPSPRTASTGLRGRSTRGGSRRASRRRSRPTSSAPACSSPASPRSSHRSP